MDRRMLMAFVEELGHDYKDLLQGASCRSRDRNLLLKAVTKQVTAKKDKREDEDEDEDEGSEDNNEVKRDFLNLIDPYALVL
ncbi:hypothetical protein VTN77DRAFT_8684 [Rasamsonia byssochlamydoides]|uniref:uncharacterized protein n=1 Tax=Rasamsonia byssochlamydoides TaxID=89139 RepID=UPI0037436810